MLLKQFQIFQLTGPIAYTPETLAEKLEPMVFTPCLPSFPVSVGWASPFDEAGSPLVYGANGYIMLCMQIEEKILPAAVIRQELNEKIKRIELLEDRRIRSKDKLAMKDEVIINLLPRAFTKITRVYAYIDTRNKRLILGTTSQTKADQFVSLFRRSFSDDLRAIDVKKPSAILTYWLKDKSNPITFSIEKACVLQDPSEQTRIIRCQQQDLFAASIQALLKDGCEVKQMALCWHDRIRFVLADDFSVRSIRLEEEVIAAAKEIDVESKQQQFAADFFLMTETYSGLIEDLLKLFAKSATQEKNATQAAEAVA